MRRFLLLAVVVVLALVASGCFEGSSTKTVHTPNARDHKAAMQLERMFIPPFDQSRRSDQGDDVGRSEGQQDLSHLVPSVEQR
jgi:hypothetical protein